MKVDIKTSAKTTGIFKKTTFYLVTLTVVLSEEERQIIKDNQLQKLVVMRRPPPEYLGGDGDFDLTFDKLLSGHDDYGTNSQAGAIEYQTNLVASLKQAKEYLTRNTQGTEDTSMEL